MRGCFGPLSLRWSKRKTDGQVSTLATSSPPSGSAGKPSDALVPEHVSSNVSSAQEPSGKASQLACANSNAPSSAQKLSGPISANPDQQSESQVGASDRQGTFSDMAYDDRSTVGTTAELRPDPAAADQPQNLLPSPSWSVLGPAGPSIEELMEFLRKIVDTNAGRCSPNLFIDSAHAPRRRLYGVECRCKTRLGRQADALFFANRVDYDKHYKMASRALLQGYMVGVAQAVPANDFRDASSSTVLRMPSYIVTDVSLSAEDALTGMGTTQRTAAITGLAVHLLSGLAVLHKKDIVHGSVARGNVVRVESGKGSWAFRELCRYTKKGREIDVSALSREEVLMLAPEAAEARYAEASPPMDIWQLGVLLYELHTGQSYWPSDITIEQALRALARKGGMPHEANPTKLQAIVRIDSTLQRQADIIARMLSRNPADRPTAVEAKADLDSSVYQQTLYGDDAAHLMVQSAVVL